MSEGEEGEGGGGGKEHFSLDKILRSEKQPKKKRKKAKKAETAEAPVDSFKVDVDDPRFKALFESHLYAPDPSAPQYRWVWLILIGCGLFWWVWSMCYFVVQGY